MEEVKGARERVLAAEAGNRVMLEGLRVPQEAPSWASFGDTQAASKKELATYEHGSDWLRLFDAANSSVQARLLSLPGIDGTTIMAPECLAG
ncbi:hypothetical protein CYMTET_39889 [Cymbomonas tetramitiformis]|uniref:Uncharacterized protein n=1 Tax=Cymbomonas tetramitiformis TaxID=36881 RepID=A0AAE0F563_9CHLO|nr:hypothetical protein CYMTET_39889 [Cymbomonas tetramitiformis]